MDLKCSILIFCSVSTTQNGSRGNKIFRNERIEQEARGIRIHTLMLELPSATGLVIKFLT
jgi:hypothetical protein